MKSFNEEQVSALTGLELRKSVLEALGWRYYHRANSAHVFLKPDAADEYFVRNGLTLSPFSEAPAERLSGNSPAIESDPAVSESMFLEWCQRKYWLWQLEESPIGQYAVHLRAKANKPAPCRLTIDVSGSTPSEARARAIVEAAKAVGKQ